MRSINYAECLDSVSEKRVEKYEVAFPLDWSFVTRFQYFSRILPYEHISKQAATDILPCGIADSIYS